MVLIDADDFNKFNDKFGHDIGDQAVIHFALIWNQACQRVTDSACRFGGEEFIIILENSTTKQAYLFAESIRKKMETKQLIYGEKSYPEITISCGVATMPQDADSIDELINKAD